MTSIRAFSEILRDTGDLTGDEQSKYASIIHDEAVRLTRLLDDLLDLSVLENGQVVLNTQTGLLSDLLDRAERAAGVNDSGLTVARDRAAEAVELTSDLDRLAQVFINLIANARKYCDGTPPVLSIRASVADGHVVVDFTDNGSGIPPEKQAVIFEKFSRIGETKAGGAGLGLAICREIMARLGGSVSYLPGQTGAAFRVSLPQARRMAAQ
jgi:signal transduction histidine kinase